MHRINEIFSFPVRSKIWKRTLELIACAIAVMIDKYTEHRVADLLGLEGRSREWFELLYVVPLVLFGFWAVNRMTPEPE